MTVRPEPPPLLTMTVERQAGIDRLLAALEAPVDFGGYDGHGIDPLHRDASVAIRELLASAETECTLKNAWTKRAYQAEAESSQLRADVARLTEENTQRQAELADLIIKHSHLQAERDALRQRIAQFRTWLDTHSEWPLSRAYECALDELDTLLPPGEATTDQERRA